MKNHTLKANSLKFESFTRSRNRVRIVVAANNHLGIKPGSRVNVFRSKFGNIELVSSPTGNYKVEKDGAVRFPAHKFGVSKDYKTRTNRVNSNIVVY